MAESLQVNYKPEDYQLYLTETKGKDVRKIAFMHALYRIRNNGHITCVVSGEFGKGKTTTAILLAKWDTYYMRLLLKLEIEKLEDTIKECVIDSKKYRETIQYKNQIEKDLKNLTFKLSQNIIISPKDPAYKNISTPPKYHSLVIDEGYLFSTTSDATTTRARNQRDQIAQNRKLNPSYYLVYSNLFKIPSLILETMMVVIHKFNIKRGILLIPSTTVQLKEKFSKDLIERYARKPRYFAKSMRWHPSFIFYPHFPKIRGSDPVIQGSMWDKYLKKYEKYKVIIQSTDADRKESNKEEALYKQFDRLIEKKVAVVKTSEDITRLFKTLLMKQGKMGNESAERLSDLLSSKYRDWKMQTASKLLLNKLNDAAIGNLKLDIDIEKEGEGI